jgi:CBS domain containing-hemolysin-like protein
MFGRKTAESKETEGPEALEQQEMIEGVEHLSDTTVKEVMVPRTDTVFLPLDETDEIVFRTLIESGHSRIPVYRESIDNVVGVLYAKDVLAALIAKKKFEISGIMRKPFFVPETKKIDSLLREFKRRKVHLAVVLDEYGGTSGIVCMEDIIEEIVGEIQDEYDNEAESCVQLGPDSWLCDAKTRLDEIGDRIGIELPEDSFDSLAGYVFDLFGRIPAERESLETEALRFTIQAMEAHRILSVKIERLARPQSEDGVAGSMISGNE